MSTLKAVWKKWWVKGSKTMGMDCWKRTNYFMFWFVC